MWCNGRRKCGTRYGIIKISDVKLKIIKNYFFPSTARCQGRRSGQCVVRADLTSLADKLDSAYVYTCYDRTNLYRNASKMEMEHGYCNKTFNPNWTPEHYYYENAIESVEWYYCKEAKLCVDMFTRWDDVYDYVLYQRSNSFFSKGATCIPIPTALTVRMRGTVMKNTSNENLSLNQAFLQQL